MGFLPKSASVEQVICAVRAARLGGTWLNAELLSKLLADGSGLARSRRQPIGQLTAREHQVLCLMVSGLDRNAIANQLHQSPNTVRTHIRNVTVKLGCHSAIEAVAVGLRAGLRPELAASGGGERYVAQHQALPTVAPGSPPISSSDEDDREALAGR